MFDYSKEMYDSFNKSLLESSFSINATLYILADEVFQDSTDSVYGDVLDGRQSGFIQRAYPLDMLPFYRIKVFPTEQFGITNNKYKTQTTSYGKFDPYDLWISVFAKDVKVRNSTYFDYTEKVEIKDIFYDIKGIVHEVFGNQPLVHVFLVKGSA